MAKVFPARMTHRHEGGLVVFMIGMRVNKPWRPDAWVPVFLAMGPMLTELFRDPSSGFLGYRMAFGLTGPHLVQYWSSSERLYEYASDPSAHHRPAWTAFNRRARKAKGAVGIYHETYEVSRAETMYVAMPRFGLARATEHVTVGSRTDRARDRIAAGGTTPR